MITISKLFKQHLYRNDSDSDPYKRLITLSIYNFTISSTVFVLCIFWLIRPNYGALTHSLSILRQHMSTVLLALTWFLVNTAYNNFWVNLIKNNQKGGNVRGIIVWICSQTICASEQYVKEEQRRSIYAEAYPVMSVYIYE